MDLQRPSVFAGQQTFSLCIPFSIKQQQLQLDHSAREKYFKRQTLNYTTSGRQDRQKPPPLELTEQEWTFLSQSGQEDRESHHLTHDERRTAKAAARRSYRPTQEPAWLKHDRQALRFFAFYQEPFSGNAVENSRRRFCIICFYLEDGTLSVYESTTDYGETRQGPILKRHKMPRADGSGFVTFTDLKLGAELELYGRVFKILDCDEFTRWFCKNAGHEIGEAVELPNDTFFQAFVMKQRPNCTPSPAVLSEIRAARAFAEASRGNTCTNKLLYQYLQNDRKVLAFHCYWENQQNFGCRTYYKLHYFLSGQRGKLPKKLGELNLSDHQLSRSEFYTFIHTKLRRSDTLLLRVVFPGNPASYVAPPCACGPILTNVRFSLEKTSFSTSRQVQRSKRNIAQPKFKNVAAAACAQLAELVSNLKEDIGREFRISIRELTDKITVFEYQKRNSGHAGGKFFEANNLQNPQTARKFTAQDFFVGAEVVLNGHTFRITAADERTMKHMEDHVDKYPRASVREVCAKEHELLTLSRAGGAKRNGRPAAGKEESAVEGSCINLDSLLQEHNCTVACPS
ncbi:hypothetical protein, conserved [Eimeria acervulina]|uniref:DM10 domain-containing protein n=1 Tax=Eimeria acervulina TaxID=5801 RepID=U6H0G6_EIMAC|nr:hypothetical protein, conserved [Eimeria acervulina]CDI84259.1 hypothetical protein, conserved [Eimeria acervulina]